MISLTYESTRKKIQMNLLTKQDTENKLMVTKGDKLQV